MMFTLASLGGFSKVVVDPRAFHDHIVAIWIGWDWFSSVWFGLVWYGMVFFNVIGSLLFGF